MTPTVADVLARHTPRLMDIPGVVGTAEGRQDGQPCIVVFVTNETDRREIPDEIEGHPVRVDETGEIGPMK